MSNKLKFSQLSGMDLHYMHWPIEYFLDSLVDEGLSAVELWGAAPHLHVDDATPELIRDVRKMISDRGLELVCYTPETVIYPINIAAREQHIRERSIKFLKRAVEVTAELGCPMMLLTPGWGYLNEPKEEALKRAMGSIADITAHAERIGVLLALEHLSPISSNLINTAADLRHAVDEISSKNLKAMLDTCQVCLVGEHIRDYIKILGDDLVHVHIVDGTPGGHLAFGDGNIPLREFVDALGESGYSGHLSMEISDRRYFMDPSSADRQSIAAFKEWIAAA